jgi:hypothetical protein
MRFFILGKKGRNIFEPTVDKMISTGEKSLLTGEKSLSTGEKSLSTGDKSLNRRNIRAKRR